MNAYSILHNYDQTRYNPDFNFINTALSYKQEASDKNKAQILSLYEQFDSLKVDKEVDQKYIEERLGQVREITNKYGALDLSDPNLGAMLQANIKQVIDGKVENAITSTYRMKIEDAKWQELEQKNPAKFSQKNKEYAAYMSDRERYRNSQEAGDLYKGGFNVIEYRDVGKDATVDMEKLQKTLGAKMFKTGPKSGYFQYQDTYEVVDPHTLRKAFELTLDEKDLQQLRVDAWHKNRGASDDELRKQFEDYKAPRIESLEKNIESLEILRSEAVGDEKDRIDKEIEANREALVNWKDNDFDEAVATRGRDSVFTSIYVDDYISSVVDTYAAPRLIDRKIDEVQKANVEFAETVRQHNISNANEAARLRIAQSAEERAQLKFEIENGLIKLPGQGGIVVDSTTPLDNPNTAMDDNAKIQKDRSDAIKNFNNFLGEGFEVTYANFGSLKKELSNLPEKLRKGESVTINGKKIKLTKENIGKFVEFHANALEVPPATIAARQEYNKGLGAMAYKLGKTIFYGGDTNPSDLPKMDFEFVENDKGVLVRKQINYESNPMAAGFAKAQGKKVRDVNNFEVLLRKAGKGNMDSLTKAEQATLKTYMGIWTLADPRSELTNAQKNELSATIRSEVLAGVTTKDLSLIPYTPEKARTAIGNATPEKVGVVGFFDIKTTIENQQSRKNYTYPSDLTINKLDYQKDGVEKNPTEDLLFVIKNAATVAAKVDDPLRRRQDAVSFNNVSYANKDAEYKGLKSLLQAKAQDQGFKEDYKQNIQIAPIPEGQGLSNFVNLRFSESVKDATGKNVVTNMKEVKVSKEELYNATGIIYEDVKPTAFSPKFGINAAKLNLGTGKSKSDFLKEGRDMVWENRSQILNAVSDDPNLKSSVERMLNDYSNGKYQFRLEVLKENEPYHVTVYKADNKGELTRISRGIPATTEPKELNYGQDMPALLEQSDVISSQSFYNFLVDYIESEKN